MDLGPTHLQRHLFQIRSPSQVPEVRMQTYLFGSFPPSMNPFPQLNGPGPHLWIVHHAFPPSSVYATVTPLPLSVNTEIPLGVLLLAHSLWLKGPSFPLEAQPLLTVWLAHLLRELFPLPALGSPPRHPPCGTGDQNWNSCFLVFPAVPGTFVETQKILVDDNNHLESGVRLILSK